MVTAGPLRSCSQSRSARPTNRSHVAAATVTPRGERRNPRKSKPFSIRQMNVLLGLDLQPEIPQRGVDEPHRSTQRPAGRGERV
jgi:hypothetical protein